jgi:hypothetical protein
MLKALNSILGQLCNECNSKQYDFILEADASGWLFHLFLSDPTINPNQVHLDTRVAGAHGRYDLVIGPTTFDTARPSISPQLVVEVKVFPRVGFTDQQHRVHYEHVLEDDLRKLGQLSPSMECRAEVLIDGCDYLCGQYSKQNRLQHLIGVRNKIATGAHIFLLTFSNGIWQLQHIP